MGENSIRIFLQKNIFSHHTISVLNNLFINEHLQILLTTFILNSVKTKVGKKNLVGVN
jgi:hypothetical protein